MNENEFNEKDIVTAMMMMFDYTSDEMTDEEMYEKYGVESSSWINLSDQMYIFVNRIRELKKLN